ncbi:MAG: LPS assembly lipoprotein LptE [Gemmatimonadota bacterium]|nr:LPS assembly lipoprotein LptE [Gemmatimonadota bacterium]
MMNPKPKPRLRPTVFLIPLLSACMVVTACYYSTSQGSRAGDIRNIVIPLFDNTTVETGIQEDLTDKVIERFLENGEFRIVDLRQADAAIIGVITNLQEESVAFSAGTQAREVRLSIVVDVRFETVDKKEVIWEERQLRTFGDYAIDTGTDSDREPALDTAIERMADEILNQSISGW